MRLKWVTNPSSNKPDPMLTMSVLAVTCACIKFLLEGVVINYGPHTFNFGHVDGTVYAALTAPILAVHGYIKGKKTVNVPKEKMDNPDGN